MHRGATEAAGSVAPLRTALAALAANLVGIGLARFGYTPLIPALIAAHWFVPSAAAYLGAANLAGYLAGALFANAIAMRAGSVRTLRAAMVVTAASLIACAAPLGFAWFFLWRVVSGVTGGLLMALAAPAVIAGTPARHRAIAGGVIFTGVGLGIAASGTLVPLLMRGGLVAAWLGLGTAALTLTAAAWRSWPADQTAALTFPGEQTRAPPNSPPVLRALYLEYALNAVGLVPHMVFLVDFIARFLGRGLHVGALYWVIFGAGALVGPLIGGHIGGRIGFRLTLRLAFAIQAAMSAIPLVTVTGPLLALSSLVLGAFVPGTVAIANGRMRELTQGAPAEAAAWRWCTIAFAIGQAIAGYGFSYIFARTADAYAVMFALGAAALLLALALDLAAGMLPVGRR
jgi:predicted MFS family arabinose efflux permease